MSLIRPLDPTFPIRLRSAQLASMPTEAMRPGARRQCRPARLARLGDEVLLQTVQADLVVTSLDEVDTAAVPDGRIAHPAGNGDAGHA